MADSIVLVTGTAGIGGAFAQVCLDNGKKVVMVDRVEKALTSVADNANLTKVCADVGTDAGVAKIKEAVGSTPVSMCFFSAACAANQDNEGCPWMKASRENLQDMFQTSILGKAMVVQALQENLKAGKARCFNVGAPFADGAMPNGKWMCIPGWGGYGAMKSASRYMWESLKVECGDVALFGYGHPGFTKTSLTMEVAENYKEDMMIAKMCKGRIAKDDFFEPSDMGKLFYEVCTKSSDEDFQGTCWSINTMCAKFPDCKVKNTSDVAGGIKLPE